MRALFTVFIALTLYGLFTNRYGAAAMSAFIACVVYVAHKQYKKADEEYRASLNEEPNEPVQQAEADEHRDGYNKPPV